jgi:hypothetical protein
MAGLTDSLRSNLDRGARKIGKTLRIYSDYDYTIPAEIKDDEFYDLIRSIAGSAPVNTMLEIGSSNGEGSTSAFVQGIKLNPGRPTLFCMEVSRPRFKQLVQRFAGEPQVRCYSVTSVPLDRFPTDAEVIEFYRNGDSELNRIPLAEVLRWLQQDRRYISGLGPSMNGIRMIKDENGIDEFGMVLIDGSEFSGRAELEEVYGAEYLLLDDIGTYKNFHNYRRLIEDPSYQLVAANKRLRNGYAAFERRR